MDSCGSPALCGPGVFEAGSKGFIVQPAWMPHHLELRLVCTWDRTFLTLFQPAA